MKSKDQILLENAYADIVQRAMKDSKIPGYQKQLEDIKNQADELEQQRKDKAAARQAEISGMDQEDQSAAAKHQAEITRLRAETEKLRTGLLKPGTPEHEAHLKKLLSLGYNPRQVNAVREDQNSAQETRQNAQQENEESFKQRMQRMQNRYQTSMDQIAQNSQQQAPVSDPQRDAQFAQQMQQIQNSQQAALASLQGQQGAPPRVTNFDTTFGIPLNDKGMSIWNNKDEAEKNETINKYKQYVKSVMTKDPKLAPIANSPIAVKLIGL